MTSSVVPEFDFTVLGAGAAGMMAAIACGEEVLSADRRVPRIAVLEKNRQAGIKVLVCGGGRCNLTNAGDCDFLIEQFGRNGRFLTPALRYFDNASLCNWFAARSVPTHEEHDGKIYPDSNQARSVVDAMVRAMTELGVDIRADNAATQVIFNPDRKLFEITTAREEKLLTKFLLIAVGGQSYTRMGTTGDGYRFAVALGHSIVTPRPAIVPLLCRESWVSQLQGLAVPDVQVRIEVPGPLPRLATGKPTPSVNDMLFTHFGLSGPAVLNISEIVAELLERFGEVSLRVNFVRRYSQDQLADLMRYWHASDGRKLVKTMLSELIPQRLAEMFCRLGDISGEQTCANLTAAQIHTIVTQLSASRVTVYQTRGFKEAMVTAGGVRLDEVDPNTMRSLINDQLYLAGEVLDLTGPSGGYNLQLAFSTGRLAGACVARRLAGMGVGKN